MALTRPPLMPLPFRGVNGPNAGLITTIPTASVPNAASLEDGFPISTMTPEGVGGVPPRGADMNGILNWITTFQAWVNAGGRFPFDATFAAAVGGYPLGAVVQLNAGLTDVISTVADNMTDPNASMTGWAVYNAPRASGGAFSKSATIVGSVGHLGAGLRVTPTSSGKFILSADGSLSMPGSLVGANTTLNLVYGVGVAPVAGATGPLGTGAPGGRSAYNLIINRIYPFALTSMVSGLVIGADYWFDLHAQGDSGSTPTFAETNLTVIEL